MKKLLAVIIAVVCMVSISGISAYATINITAENTDLDVLQNVQTHPLTENIQHDTNYAAEIGLSSIKEVVVINNVENYLYPTFDNLDTSLEKLENAIPDYYKLVKDQVDLKTLYNSDYEHLLQAKVFPEINSVANETKEQNGAISEKKVQLLNEERTFEIFYDIYENKAKNNEIKDYLANNPNPDAETLAMLLPYSCPFSIEYFQTRDDTLRSSAQYFNIENGITYATNYATSVNTIDYGYFSLQGDCTNFASQILVGGGINMHDMYPDEQNGWWHRRIIDGLGHSQHRYSVSWINADRFVRFMGASGNIYTSFYTFSTKLRRGDFIAYDKGQDGDWNHVGFATAVGSYGTYSYTDDSGVLRSKYYRDFKVAQHSREYHAWTSSDTNNWEALDGTAKFAIVRRGAVA